MDADLMEANMEDCENDLNQPQIKEFSKKKMNVECMNYFEAYRMSTDKTSKNESKKCAMLQNDLMKFSRRTSRKEEVLGNEGEVNEIVNLIANGNFNILLYGIGSKVTLMSHICDKMNEQFKGKFKVIDTYCNNENYMKQLQTEAKGKLVEDYKKCSAAKTDIKETIKKLSGIVLIKVNMIDNLLLAFPEQLLELSKFALLTNVRFLCSVANVNAFKLCNSAILSNFGFIYKCIQTLQVYTEKENAHLMLSKKSEGAEESLISVIQSMNENQQKAFYYIAYQMLNNPDLTSKNLAQDEGILTKEMISATLNILRENSIITEVKKGGQIKINLQKNTLEKLANKHQ